MKLSLFIQPPVFRVRDRRQGGNQAGEHTERDQEAKENKRDNDSQNTVKEAVCNRCQMVC